MTLGHDASTDEPPFGVMSAVLHFASLHPQANCIRLLNQTVVNRFLRQL
jgi:hypothetical protein